MPRQGIEATLLAVLMTATLPAWAKYIPDPIVKYQISARLDPRTKMVHGSETIEWRNASGDTITDLQFHLYLNAFKNTQTTFMREGGGTQRRVKFRAREDAWGYMQVRRILVDGEDLTIAMEYIQPDDGNKQDQTVMRLPLTHAIGPGGRAKIEIEWVSKLPRVFARTGFQDDFFFVAQWYPKPGVYEAAGERHRGRGGWNCHQFHAQSEFYADFGTFDVDLTVPRDFAVAATGMRRSRTENPDGTATYNYYQEDVHDFAWVAQPLSQVVIDERTFVANERVTEDEYREWAEKTGVSPDELRLDDVRIILFMQKEHAAQATRHYWAVAHAIKWYGLWYGKYPYETITVVDPPWSGSGAGGMEYPTLITAGTVFWPGKADLHEGPESVTVHEFGHQYWYGLVANNEFEEAWLDEGFNTYSTGKVLERTFGPDYSYEYILGVPVPARPWVKIWAPRYPWKGVKQVGIGQYWEWVPLFQQYGRTRAFWEYAATDQVQRNAWEFFNRESYSAQSYAKTELTLRTLEEMLGDRWPRVMRTYFQRWRFRHPDAQDFMAVVREVSGRDMGWFFDQSLNWSSTLEYSVTFHTGKRTPKEGYFDDNGEPKLVTASPAPAPGTPDNVESEVIVRRLGNMRFPVVLHVRFADGKEVRERWDGNYRWAKFQYRNRPAIVSAEIDRDFTWKLEVPRTDNSALAEPVRLAADKWYLRWVVWIQNVLMTFSFFA
ncbi:MAG TPA: M1 family metallopeptidase [Terriglobales bacterium]|nr:M1 family metallopeptidase [Terriglobales bacterium]